MTLLEIPLTTYNVIIGAVITFMGALILFALGVIVSYVRSINKNTRDSHGAIIAHKTRLDNHEKRLDGIDEKLYNIQKK